MDDAEIRWHRLENRAILSRVMLPVPSDITCRAVVVATLRLSHFRNYSHLRLDLDAGPVVLTGDNGAGKTNLLEAISFLTPGRGLRKAAYREIDGHAAGEVPGAPWTIHAEVEGGALPVAIGTGRDGESVIDRRVVKIDGKPARGEALARVFSAIWLTPQMDPLFQEGGSGRRRFLDRMVYAFEPEHAGRVTAYESAMRERNRLLADRRMDDAWLSALEARMSAEGVAIALSRQTTIERLNAAILSSERPFPKAELSIGGDVENWLGGPAAVAEEAFRARLKDSRHRDQATGRTGSGIHRSHFGVVHTAKGRPAEECSTGEQKAMLLSMVLALARAKSYWTGIVPVLLLDEVVAHLDETKRAHLFEELTDLGAQAWLTGTDAGMFARLNAQGFHVEGGTLRTL